MNKEQLARALARNTTLDLQESRAAIDAIFAADDGLIADALEAGEVVDIRGFGKFATKELGTGAPRPTKRPPPKPPRTSPIPTDPRKFVPGGSYQRRAVHAAFGGQSRGGISTPAKYPVIFLFTGESGKPYGYQDGFQPDGTFWYTGEGQIGDMPMLRGNLAIRDSGVNGKTLHLFQTDQKGWVQYLGEASYAGHHFAPAPDRNGNPRRAIVFELVTASHGSGEPADRQVVDEVADDRLWRKPLEELRDLATRTPHNQTPKERKTNAYQRSQAVKVYVLKRARGVCEGCRTAAPFKTPKGRGYLEPHHLRRRADQGPDHPRWVAALCPNCHREVHYGEHGPKLNEQLAARLEKVERS